MSKSLRNTLILIGAVVSGAALLLVGAYLGRVGLRGTGFWTAPSMHRYSSGQVSAGFWSEHPMLGITDQANIAPYETMMGSRIMGYGMMGFRMVGHNMMGPGMMSPFASSGLYRAEALTFGETQDAVEQYLDDLGDQEMAIGEIMIFDNHAYAQIIEASTGISAFEVLVDPVTLAIIPEPGANMMWNFKYSPMGMMGGFGSQLSDYVSEMMAGTASQDILDEMSVDPEEAIQVAQRYLDAYLPSAEADEHVDAFYGYYTLHILEDGDIVGMLSVNGYSREVMLHTWHGDLLEIGEVN